LWLPPDTNLDILWCHVDHAPFDLRIDCGIDGCFGWRNTILELDKLDHGIQVADSDTNDIVSREEHAETIPTGGNELIAGHRVGCRIPGYRSTIFECQVDNARAHWQRKVKLVLKS
jgi:hypothetical protein